MKIYSDKSFLPSGFICHMMIPFWSYSRDASDPDDTRFEKYEQDGKNIFQLTNLKDADIAVYPASPTQNPERFIKFQNITKPKYVIAFFNDDSDILLNYREKVYIFRTSFYKSKQRPTEFALPAWTADHGLLPIRKWTPKPTVSFCGQSNTPRNVRETGLQVLEKHSGINTKFIRRQQFWAGWLSSGRRLDIGRKVRREFISNISDSDYVFCARGGGNFSYRIYEVLMSGRIPLLLNTDCVLPYDFYLNWNDLIPTVDIRNISRLGEELLLFHNKLSHKFEEHQKLLRSIWEDYISPTGFFKNFYRHFGV